MAPQLKESIRQLITQDKVELVAATVQPGLPINQCYRITAGGTPFLNVRDGRIPNAPSWRGTLTARYERDLPGSDLALFGQVSTNAQTKVNFSLEQDPDTVQGGYAIFDAKQDRAIKVMLKP